MRARLRIGLAAGLALAGCNSEPANEAEANRTAIKVRSADQDRMHELDAFNLAIALKRAIYDAGYMCKRVTDAGFAGEYKNLDMWVADCTDGKNSRQWAVFTGPDGSAQIRDCKDVAASGLPECRIERRPKGSFNELPGAASKNSRG